MKKLQKLLVIMWVAVMMMAVGVIGVMADDADTDAYSITVSGVDSTEHDLVAYQIFSGYTSNGVVSNVTWGTGVTAYQGSYGSTLTDSELAAATEAESELFDELEDTSEFSAYTFTSAQEVANALSGAAKDSDKAQTFANVVSGYLTNNYTAKASAASTADSDGTYTYTFSNLAAGYYLVMDASTSNTSSAYTYYILVVAGNAQTDSSESEYTSYNHVTIKTSYPTVSKTVSDSTASIGDTVTFTLTGTVPDMTYYSTYSYTFNDTLSEELTIVSETSTETGTEVTTYDLTVYGSDGDDSTDDTEISSSEYTLKVTSETDGTTSISVAFSDLKSVTNIDNYKYIIVKYTATLNSKADLTTTSTASASNSVSVTYSNDPNWVAETESEEEPTGTTVTEEVYVHTFGIEITKYNAGTTPLEGAYFTLYKVVDGVTYYVIVDSDNKVTGWTTDGSIETSARSELESNSKGKIYVYGLDEGTYYLQELKAPDGYNLLSDPVEITITANLDTNDGSFSSLYAQSGTTTLTTSGSIAYISINNNLGSSLPTTGGIGTTIFYIIGAILVLGAAVVLVTRRRMAR